MKIDCSWRSKFRDFLLEFSMILCAVKISSQQQTYFSSQNFNPFPQQYPQAYQPLNVVPFASNNLVANAKTNTISTLLDVRKMEEQIDSRLEEGWPHLYPFGVLYNDKNIGLRLFNDYQIDLDFDFPYYGFRFNYTIIYPNGLIAFSYPDFKQPPWTFPNPKWPEEGDASFIAAFYADQHFQFVGDVPISSVYYRTVYRPKMDSFYSYTASNNYLNSYFTSNEQKMWSDAAMNAELFKNRPGRVYDALLLDNITADIQDGIIGANGFRAEYALIVTWERMAYGGAPKITNLGEYLQAKKWFNTYQLAIATDEIRSYAILNYAHINWTSSTSAGSLHGRGGYQSAIAGFNAGNGTGWTPLPYSGEGRSIKLTGFSNVMKPGRWLYRVDEEIITGGCSNTSAGIMYTAPIVASMLGGVTVNVSGPCFRQGDVIKVVFDEYGVDCVKLNDIRASCVLPVDKIFKVGMVTTRLSRDGGSSYPYAGTFYIVQPALAMPTVLLLDDPVRKIDCWRSWNATSLSLQWSALNLTSDASAKVDITLWGYWEDTDDHVFEQIGVVARDKPNNGRYTFSPSDLYFNEMLHNAWKKHNFGVVRVSLSNRGNVGSFWSHLTPFGWYFRDKWEYEYGSDWAFDKCIEWFNYDGARLNFFMDLERKIPCPCTLDQALLDMGRYTALFGCDREGDTSCDYNKGSQHCVVSVAASWNGAGQVCCYDFDGWLLLADDYENAAYVRFYSPGVSQRGHPFGSYPFKRPPYVPSMSNFYTDKMAFETCCRWAGYCEFYYWRRPTSGCIDYRPPVAGYVFGEPHFVTFDGVRYSFQGRGYYILTMAKDPVHDLMVQVRLEQPPKSLSKLEVGATVVTGVAAQENESDIVQIFVRKEFRNWRYRTDVLVNGVARYFDTPELKLQKFRGVTLRTFERNHNQSEVIVMFDSGAGLRVAEAYGMLDATVILPPEYNQSDHIVGLPYQTYDYRQSTSTYAPNRFANQQQQEQQQSYYARAGTTNNYMTLGLLGTFNGFADDDLMAPDGSIYPPSTSRNSADLQNLFTNFGEKWKIQNGKYKLLFQDSIKPVYNPLLFASDYYNPVFDPNPIALNASLLYSIEEVKSTCQGIYECQYDYIMTGMREVGINSMEVMFKLENLKARGSKIWISCGALRKDEGVLKYPPGNNYLSGVTVTFTCKPEYFIHGDQQRTCVNGTWTHGWWVWCRHRTAEYALKWLAGISVSLVFVLICAAIFFGCYARRKGLNQDSNFPVNRSLAKSKPVASSPKGTRKSETMTIVEEPVQLSRPPISVGSSGSNIRARPPSSSGAVYYSHSRRIYSETSA